MRCVAVDWSGRRTGAERFIWIAEVLDGELVTLEAGRDRSAAVDWVIARGSADPGLVAGFDFAFSFPAWYCAAHGWSTAPEVWRAMARDGERLLDACPPPFWGRPGVGRRLPVERGLRRTDRVDVPGAKSVFQIGGSGTVGTGSIRGMPELLRLAGAGFGVWPLHGSGSGSGSGADAGAGRPVALEIYPRAMYGRSVRKSRAGDRRAVLAERFADHDSELLERAAGSEDAFDAAVSALVMSAHVDALRALPDPSGWELEGRVWTPPPGYPGSPPP